MGRRGNLTAMPPLPLRAERARARREREERGTRPRVRVPSPGSRMRAALYRELLESSREPLPSAPVSRRSILGVPLEPTLPLEPFAPTVVERVANLSLDKALPSIMRQGAIVITPSSLPAVMVPHIRTWRPGAPLRIPHYSVSRKGLIAEFDLARGGVLVLADLDEFAGPDLNALIEHRDALASIADVIIVGTIIESIDAQDRALELAGEFDLPVWRMLDDGSIEPVYGDPFKLIVKESAQAELEFINRWRTKVGQRPLDPVAAGWEPEDVLAEAERIRTLNPRRLKRRLLR